MSPLRIKISLRVLSLALLGSRMLPAQTGGFIATLGRDTVHAESFTRVGDTLRGVIVTRVPATRIAQYTMVFGPSGRPTHYEIATTDAAGNPVQVNGAKGTLTWQGDTLVRETLQNGAMATQSMYAPAGAYPTPAIPYIGVSYLMYEQAFADARRRAPTATEAEIPLLWMGAAQKAPQGRKVWFIGKDSAEADYFGVARSGYRFDDAGRLLRSDWTGTTYRYRVSRVPSVDVRSLARDWSALDASGYGIGALSPLDTTRATAGAAQLTIAYSRPSQRGRVLWGDVVPSNQVWRLGADMATHFTTTQSLIIGEAAVPAGRYTLWMQYASDGPSYLIVNKRTNIFGTMYDPRQDLVRIPLKRLDGQPQTERLTIDVERESLRIRWGDVAWVAPIHSTGG